MLRILLAAPLLLCLMAVPASAQVEPEPILEPGIGCVAPDCCLPAPCDPACEPAPRHDPCCRRGVLTRICDRIHSRRNHRRRCR